MRPPRVPGLVTLVFLAGCTSEHPILPHPFASVVSVTTVLVVSDQASCTALPITTTWEANNCILGEDLTLGSGGGLQIENVRVSVPAGITLTNDGGTITVVFGGLFRIQGTLANTGGGTIHNSGFWDVRDGGAITNAAGSSIETSNQLHVTQGTLTNAGSLSNTQYMSISIVGTVTNSGTLENSGTIKMDGGTFDNSGTIHNTGTIDVGCSTGFHNTGTLTGNPILVPFCWVGGHGVLWSTAANWNTNSPPTAAGPIIIKATSGPTLDVPFTLTGTLTMQLSTLVIGATATLTNQGTITLGQGGQPPASTVIRNEGTLVNGARLNNNDLLINHGTAINNATIEPTTVVGVVENSGTFINAAGALLEGGLRGLSGGNFQNWGQVNLNRTTNSNAGLVANQSGATLNVNNALSNDGGGRIENDGTLNITHALTFPGRIDNASGATIVNRAQLAITDVESALNNDGLVENTGTIANGGIIQNDGVICGGGTVSGNAVSGNAPQATCNTAPTADPGGPYTGQEGVPMALSLSGSDPDGQALTFTWDLGDGTTGSGATPPTSHTYGDNPAPPATGYTITLTVDDGAGGTDTKTTTARVSNRAPTGTFAPVSSVDEGGTFTLTLTGIQDVAADLPTLERRFDCGTGFGPWGTAPSRTCPATDDATLPVGAEIRDKDGGSNSYTASVTVVNVPPSLGPLALPPDPVPVGNVVTIWAPFTDPGAADTHTGFVRWNPGASLDPASPGVDQTAHTLTAAAALAPDVYQPALLVRDDGGGEDSRLATSVVVVYDPDGGFLTGGGWFNSPAGAGKGHFTVNAEYHGPGRPEGDVSFELPSAGLEFASTALRWLVVTPGLARVEGEGTVGGVAGYGIRLTAADGAAPGGKADRVRVRIWNLVTGTPVYDSQPGEPPESVATAPLGGGNVTIHR